MIELDNRALQFLESIRQEGERSCATIRNETDAQIAAELEKTRTAEEGRAKKTLEYETNRADVQANRSLSGEREATRARLAARRSVLSDAVFADARAKVAAFTKTADYAAWLAASAKDLAGDLGRGTILYARPADLKLIENNLPAGVTLQADDTITLGGLKAANGALAADDTLESRLDAQHDWFLEHSGLSISI